MGDAPEWDISINVRKGKSGYGIYFTNNVQTGVIRVTKLDTKSEAELAGVQPEDILYSVKDLDCVTPPEAPGTEIIVDQANYQSTLNYVRSMKYCQLRFISGSAMKFD